MSKDGKLKVEIYLLSLPRLCKNESKWGLNCTDPPESSQRKVVSSTATVCAEDSGTDLREIQSWC